MWPEAKISRGSKESSYMAVTKGEGLLSALFYRNYRYLWASTLGVATVASVEQVVLGWLVLELTNSPALVGVVAACRFAGMGLAPFGGALADRFNRRRILLLMQVAGILYALTFVTLYYTSLLQTWHIFALALFIGVVRGFDNTTRTAGVADTVESRHWTSAVGLLLVSMSITVVIGSLTAGYLFKAIGPGGCFAVMAGAFLFAGLMLFPIGFVVKVKAASQESVWKSVLTGARYIIDDKGLSALMLLATIANLFAFPCTIGIMPVFARDVLHLGSDGLGWLIAAEGVGGLIGALFISSLGKFRHKGWFLIAAMLAWPLLLGIFSLLRLLYISLALLVIAGIARVTAMGFIQVLLLAWSSEEVRGRVMGVRVFVIIMLMVGNLLSGAGASLWGSAIVFQVNALLCIVTTVFTIVWAPVLYRRQ